MAGRFWSNREKWSAECLPARPDERYYGDDHLDPIRAIRGGDRTRWSQMRQMKVGDYFEIGLGKSRVVAAVQFVHDGHGYPKQYKFSVRQGGVWVEDGKYDGPIKIIFGSPKKIDGVRVEVVEPQIEPIGREGNPPAWSIYDVRITEVRLCGRWWRTVIAE